MSINFSHNLQQTNVWVKAASEISAVHPKLKARQTQNEDEQLSHPVLDKIPTK